MPDITPQTPVVQADLEHFFDVVSWAGKNRNKQLQKEDSDQESHFSDLDFNYKSLKHSNTHVHQDETSPVFDYKSKPAILRISVNSFDDIFDSAFENSSSKGDDTTPLITPKQTQQPSPTSTIQQNSNEGQHQVDLLLSKVSNNGKEGSFQSSQEGTLLETPNQISTAATSYNSVEGSSSQKMINTSPKISVSSSTSFFKQLPRKFTSNFSVTARDFTPSLQDEKAKITWSRSKSFSNILSPNFDTTYEDYKGNLDESRRLQKLQAKSELETPQFDCYNKVENSFYDLTCKTYDNKNFDFKTLKGKVVIIINVATFCGFSFHLKGLQKLYEAHYPKVEILGFLSNDYWQEPGSSEKASDRCSKRYNTQFPIMEKVKVNGSNAHNVYKFLKSSKAPESLKGKSIHEGNWGVGKDGKFGRRLLWNYEKFVIDSDGNVVKRFPPWMRPSLMNEMITELVEEASL